MNKTTSIIVCVALMNFCCKQFYGAAPLHDLDKQLVIAALTGDIRGARELLKASPHPYPSRYDISLFLESVRWNCFEEQPAIALAIVENNDIGEELLNEAIKRTIVQSKNDILRALIVNPKGPQINALDVDGKALLHHAAFVGNLEAVKMLTEEVGADRELLSADGMSPLRYAELNKQTDVADYLRQPSQISQRFFLDEKTQSCRDVEDTVSGTSGLKALLLYTAR